MHEIRKATPDDIDVVARIWSTAWQDGHVGHVPEGLVRHRTPESFRSRVPERIDATWVGEVDGAVVGFVTLDGDELEQIFVDAAARGSGLAAELLHRGEDELRAAGHQRAWLAVVADNKRARAFYERLGWRDGGDFPYEAQTDEGPFVVPCQRYEIDL